jgi:ketosteroid isomerase-like protein
MSQENVERVRSIYGLGLTKDWSQIPEFFHPDVEVDLSRRVFNPGVRRGHDGIEDFLRENEEMWDDFSITPTEIIGAGNHVFATITMSGKGKSSGVDTTMEVMNVWTFRDSKVVRVVGGYRDRAEALDAAGLSE